MKIEVSEINGASIAEVISDEIELGNVQDALDLMVDCVYQGARSIIMDKKNITADFFDLSTRVAGEVLQKFSTYNVKLAIVGDFSEYTSKSLKDFIHESNTIGRIIFVGSVDMAKEKMAGK